MSMMLNRAGDHALVLEELPKLERPRNVLMVRPTHYDIEYVINPHMAAHVGNVDRIAALNEWQHLAAAYRELGLGVRILDGAQGFPDMVFCANQSFPWIDADGGRHLLMSRMASERRQGEVAPIRAMFGRNGYRVHEMPDEGGVFEGCGDAIWHAERRLIWGGWGFRTSREAYRTVAELTGAPVALLELTQPGFYHLDTCLCVLDRDHVLICEEAFTADGVALIESLVPTVIRAPLHEASALFAVNACCPDGRNVFIQQGCTDVNKTLRDHGFHVHEFSTFEFMKSGGSVFCMKLLYW